MGLLTINSPFWQIGVKDFSTHQLFCSYRFFTGPLSSLQFCITLSHCYHIGHSFFELFQCIIILLLRKSHNICQTTFSCPFSVHLPIAGVNRYSQSYVCTTGQLWNTFPSSVFPNLYKWRIFFQTQFVQILRTDTWLDLIWTNFFLIFTDGDIERTHWPLFLVLWLLKKNMNRIHHEDDDLFY